MLAYPFIVCFQVCDIIRKDKIFQFWTFVLSQKGELFTMKFHAIQADLFEYENEYALVHCISSDCVMGAGIAPQFVKRYGLKRDLISLNPKVGQAILWQRDSISVLNLITKKYVYQKPTLKTLEESLRSMKKQVIKNQIKKLAMPLIGCGLDRLRWEDVEKLIKDMFEDVDVEILVCYLAKDRIHFMKKPL